MSAKTAAAWFVALIVRSVPSAGYGQAAAPPAQPGHANAELAKKLSNPISDLVSVPFQFNWEQNVGPMQWTVPINVLVPKLSSFGVFPASYQIGFGAFVAHPDIGPSWKIRGAIVILLPRRAG